MTADKLVKQVLLVVRMIIQGFIGTHQFSQNQ